MKESVLTEGRSASEQIDNIIAGLGDWRGETLGRIRGLIQEAGPDIVEEVKWKKPSNPPGVPVWAHWRIIYTCESYQAKVKLNFAQGASLQDPAKLFNSSLDGNIRREIDIQEKEMPDAEAFKALIQAAVAENLRSSTSKS